MDLRKVQVTGGASLTVTLPKGWAEKVRLVAGDVVGCLEQPDGSLAIHPHAKGARELQRYPLDVSDEDGEYVFRKTIAAYLMGYDVIQISSRRPLSARARAAIRQAARRIIGLEIVEETATGVTLQDFLDPREFHLEKALRRMAMLTQAMQEDAYTSLLGADRGELLASIQERDDEVDRLYWLVNKQYHAILRDAGYAAKAEMTASQALNVLLVARLVERTADHAGRLAEQSSVLQREGQAMEAFLGRLEKEARASGELFRESVQVFLKRDAVRANQLIGQANEFRAVSERLLKDAASLSSEAMSHLAFMVESIGRTAAYAADIGEVAINHKVASS